MCGGIVSFRFEASFRGFACGETQLLLPVLDIILKVGLCSINEPSTPIETEMN